MTDSPLQTTDAVGAGARSRTAPKLASLAGERTHQQSEWRRAWRRFSAYKPGIAGAVFIAALILTAIFAPLLAPYDPFDTNTSLRNDAPTASHVLGNDATGRDILSRLIYGTRIALAVGLGATIIAVSIGVVIGASAGFFGGKADLFLSRIIDTLMAFPTIALLMVIGAVLSPSIGNIIFAIGITVWSTYARVVRADVLSLRERDFILAARSIGAPSSRIIFRHLMPNVLGSVIILASLAIGGIIIYESALSFLGLGLQPPEPSWGRMLSDGRDYIRSAPHITIAPGIAITLTVLAFNLVGDGLRDALDPKGRR